MQDQGQLRGNFLSTQHRSLHLELNQITKWYQVPESSKDLITITRTLIDKRLEVCWPSL